MKGELRIVMVTGVVFLGSVFGALVYKWGQNPPSLGDLQLPALLSGRKPENAGEANGQLASAPADRRDDIPSEQAGTNVSKKEPATRDKDAAVRSSESADAPIVVKVSERRLSAEEKRRQQSALESAPTVIEEKWDARPSSASDAGFLASALERLSSNASKKRLHGEQQSTKTESRLALLADMEKAENSAGGENKKKEEENQEDKTEPDEAPPSPARVAPEANEADATSLVPPPPVRINESSPRTASNPAKTAAARPESESGWKKEPTASPAPTPKSEIVAERAKKLTPTQAKEAGREQAARKQTSEQSGEPPPASRPIVGPRYFGKRDDSAEATWNGSSQSQRDFKPSIDLSDIGPAPVVLPTESAPTEKSVVQDDKDLSRMEAELRVSNMVEKSAESPTIMPAQLTQSVPQALPVLSDSELEPPKPAAIATSTDMADALPPAPTAATRTAPTPMTPPRDTVFEPANPSAPVAVNETASKPSRLAAPIAAAPEPARSIGSNDSQAFLAPELPVAIPIATSGDSEKRGVSPPGLLPAIAVEPDRESTGEKADLTATEADRSAAPASSNAGANTEAPAIVNTSASATAVAPTDEERRPIGKHVVARSTPSGRAPSEGGERGGRRLIPAAPARADEQLASGAARADRFNDSGRRIVGGNSRTPFEREALKVYEYGDRGPLTHTVRKEGVQLVNGDQSPAEPVKVVSYDVESYLILSGDSFDRIAKSMYGASELGPALAKYNRSPAASSAALEPGVRIRIPPAGVLQRMGVTKVNVASRNSGNPLRYASERTVESTGVVQAAPAPSPAPTGAAPSSTVPILAPAASQSALPVQAQAKPERPTDSQASPARPTEATPVASRPGSNQAKKPPSAEPPMYRVARSETLFAIAKKTLGDGLRWKEIYALNQDQLENEINVPVGITLRLPPDARTRF